MLKFGSVSHQKSACRRHSAQAFITDMTYTECAILLSSPNASSTLSERASILSIYLPVNFRNTSIMDINAERIISYRKSMNECGGGGGLLCISGARSHRPNVSPQTSSPMAIRRTNRNGGKFTCGANENPERGSRIGNGRRVSPITLAKAPPDQIAELPAERVLTQPTRRGCRLQLVTLSCL